MDANRGARRDRTRVVEARRTHRGDAPPRGGPTLDLAPPEKYKRNPNEGRSNVFSRILTVCIGNICRSPMAEAFLANRLRERGFGVTVESAGIAALVGRPADPMALQVMGERGIDISAHRARQLTPELLRNFELVLVMDAEQQRAVEAISPSSRGRVHRLGRWGQFDVPDPYRRERAAFDHAFALIQRGVDDLEKAFWSRR